MIRIVADSSCDISQDEAKKLNIEIAPIPVSFGNDTYMDGIDINADKFYEMLVNSKELPTTAQVNPLEYIERFEEVAKTGDSLLIITLSSKLSGSYGNACMFRKEVDYPEIEIVDSLNTMNMMKILVREAVKKRDEGLNVHEIAEYLNKFKKRIKLVAVIDTLEYLHKGGRLSGTAKVFGTLLNIKPLISVIDGEVRMIGKKSGTNKALEQLAIEFDKFDRDPNYPIIFGYTMTTEKMDAFIERLKVDHNLGNYETSGIGPVVGVHIGPSACAVTCVVKEGTE